MKGKKQIDAVYPILRKLLKYQELCYLDPAKDENFTSKVKAKDVFIDDVHFSPYGAEVFSKYIQNNLNVNLKIIIKRGYVYIFNIFKN